MAKGKKPIAVLIPGVGFSRVMLSPEEWRRFRRWTKAKQREYLDRAVAEPTSADRRLTRPVPSGLS